MVSALGGLPPPTKLVILSCSTLWTVPGEFSVSIIRMGIFELIRDLANRGLVAEAFRLRLSSSRLGGGLSFMMLLSWVLSTMTLVLTLWCTRLVTFRCIKGRLLITVIWGCVELLTSVLASFRKGYRKSG